jgi:ComF family protein
MLSFFKRIYNNFSAKICCICHNYTDLAQELCGNCHSLFPILKNACYRCGNQLALETEHIICKNCVYDPPPFSRLCAPYKYDSWPKQLVQSLKYNHNLGHVRLLANLFVAHYQAKFAAAERLLATSKIPRSAALPDAIIPVPLHPIKLQKRGFNQSYLIANIIAKQLKLAIIPDLVIKHKHTTEQAALNLSARKRNLLDSFMLLPSGIKKLNATRYRQLVIFDDVVTTMSTVSAMCELLNNIGVDAENIHIWCICRA